MKKRKEKREKKKDDKFKNLKDKIKISLFIQSFNPKNLKTLAYTLVLDIALFALLFFIVMFLFRLMTPLLTQLQTIVPLLQSINTMPTAEISAQVLPLAAVLVKMKLYTLLFFLLFLFSWTFFKGLIWNILRKRMLFSPMHYLKLLGFNAVYFILFTLVFYNSSVKYLKQNIAPYVMLFLIIPLLIYLAVIFYAVFEKRFFSSHFITNLQRII